jgi:hypothetical protein
MLRWALAGSFLLFACSAAEGDVDLSGVTRELVASPVERTTLMPGAAWATCAAEPRGERFAFRCKRAEARDAPYKLDRLSVAVRTARDAGRAAEVAIPEGVVDVRSDLRADDFPLTVRTSADVLAPSSVVVPRGIAATMTADLDAPVELRQPFDVWPIRIDTGDAASIEIRVPDYTFGPSGAPLVATLRSIVQHKGSATLFLPVPSSGSLEAWVRTSPSGEMWSELRTTRLDGPGRYVADGEIVRHLPADSIPAGTRGP